MDLDDCIKRWKIFTQDIQNGYVFGIEDYINDMGARDFIQRKIDDSSPEEKRFIKLRISKSDETFLGSTIEIEKSLIQAKNPETYFWWKRVPKKLVGELKEDLINLEFIHN